MSHKVLGMKEKFDLEFTVMDKDFRVVCKILEDNEYARDFNKSNSVNTTEFTLYSLCFHKAAVIKKILKDHRIETY